MDLRELNEFPTGIAQYDMPQSYELVGNSYEFLMDDGLDYTLKFVDRKTVEWNLANEKPQKASNFLCVKGDDTTYLVSYELEGSDLRTNHTWVIDLENWLVTRVLACVGDNPRYPFLITPKYEFGAIKQDGVDFKVYPRHGYTEDMVGNVVQWNYGAMETVHVYHCSNYYRITYPPEKAASRVFNQTLSKLPSSDEPVAYIKIKKGMYLFSLTEANAEKIIGEDGVFPYRSNTMAFLMNFKRVYLAGRTFGTLMDVESKKITPLHLTFGAVGKILQPTEEYILKLLTDPNPYIV